VKAIRVTVAKEVGQGMPIEETTVTRKKLRALPPALIKTDSGDSRQGGGDEESR